MKRVALALLVLAGCITEPGLSVAMTGSGVGRVVSDPAGIDCGETCGMIVDGPLTLTAIPEGGSVFGGWKGGGCSGTEPACSPVLTDDAVIEAQFDARYHPLTITRTGAGTVVSDRPGIDCGNSCTASFVEHTLVTLTATPSPGYAHLGWAGGGCADEAGPCEVVTDEDLTVDAQFARMTVLTVQLSGAGEVSSVPYGASCSPTHSPCSATFSPRATVTLTASPVTGKTFIGWGGACSGTSTCVVPMDLSRLVTAEFTP